MVCQKNLQFNYFLNSKLLVKIYFWIAFYDDSKQSLLAKSDVIPFSQTLECDLFFKFNIKLFRTRLERIITQIHNHIEEHKLHQASKKL